MSSTQGQLKTTIPYRLQLAGNELNHALQHCAINSMDLVKGCAVPSIGPLPDATGVQGTILAT